MRLLVFSSLLFAALVQFSEQACNNASLVQCSYIQVGEMPAVVDLPAANEYCSNATRLANCTYSMNCQPSDAFSFDSSYSNAIYQADVISYFCASENIATWAANSQCIATGGPTAYQSCYDSLGAANVTAISCSFYTQLHQCVYNRGSQICNPQSAALVTAKFFFSVRASMAMMGCNLTLPSSSTCTPCNLQCQYGMLMDNMGCPLCSSGCINPCQTVLCQQNQVCVPVCNLNPMQTTTSCAWGGACVSNITQRCDANAFSQCVEPIMYYPATSPTPTCSQVAVYDRCLHSIGCVANDTLYPMLISGLLKASSVKLQCAYINQLGVQSYAHSYMCASNAFSSVTNSCNIPPTTSDQCGNYAQIFQCYYNTVKTSCNVDAANVFVSQQVLSNLAILANMSIICNSALIQPWAAPCVNCTTTCQYGYAIDALGCSDCNKCNNNPCQTKTCLTGQTCNAVCNPQGTNIQCTATCIATNGGLSSVKNVGLVWWQLVLYSLITIVAAATMRM